MDHKVSVSLLSVALATVFVAGCVEPLDVPDVHEIEFWVEQMDWEIHPGVFTPVWAFCAEGDAVEPVHDGPCGVPAPTIRVKEGDTIRLSFKNTHAIPHTVHFHGKHPFNADMNGNPLFGDSMVADPGETETIEWVADPAGSFIYHCHFDTPMHMEMGMYGAFIVEERDFDGADVDMPLILDEWQIREPGEMQSFGNMPAYNYFTINGKSFPLTQPIVAEQGDHVRLHMVNAGYEFHAMHMHGYTPNAWEGVAGEAAAFRTDVKEIAPGQTVVLDFIADREGAWLFHDHVVPRVTAASTGHGDFGAYPRGMLTLLIVGEQYLDAVLDAVPGLLEAASKDTDGSHSGHGTAPEASEEPADPVDETPEPSGDTYTSPMKDFVFEPEIRVSAGTTVTWVNEDGFVHTVTADDGAFDSGDIAGGASWSWTFDQPGEYPYYCAPHSYQDDDGNWQGMIGTVIVE